ncbi:MAG: glycosyltransferase [Synechocystis sp.]
MTKFGIFCPAAIGHLNPMCALALELKRRGHTVIFFGLPDALKKIENLDLLTKEIGRQDFPLGSIDDQYKILGKLTGKEGFKFTIDFCSREAQTLFNEAPQAIREEEIEILIIDQITTAAATIADYLDIPFVTICNAMLVHREPAIPPYSTPWQYSDTPWARLRNRLGNALVNYLTRDLWNVIVQQRQQWNLPPYHSRNDSYSSLAQICQLPQAFDFPRECLPAHFHYVGRFQAVSGKEPITFPNTDFPFEQLNGKPLVYASLGTLQNQRPEIFESIAQACSTLDVQLVISLGNPTAIPMPLPGDPIVVPFAPHQQLIERSAVVITHAGMNTVLTALGCGVPLVAIPITNEQPGIAARLARTKAGIVIQLKSLNVETLHSAIAKVLTDPSYRNQAQTMQDIIQQAGGVDVAADIIEKVAQTKQPVLSNTR